MTNPTKRNVSIAAAVLVAGAAIGAVIGAQTSPVDDARRHISQALTLNSRELSAYSRGDIDAAKSFNTQEAAALQAAIAVLDTTSTTSTTVALPTTRPPRTTTTTVTVPTTTIPSGSVACSAIVSMSQGRQIYLASPGLATLLGGEWMVAYSSGNGLDRWTDPTLWSNLDELGRCGTDAEIGRVVFLFDPTDTPGAEMNTSLDTVAGIVATRYPNATFIPTLMVGADNHVICQVGGVDVYASVGHAARIDDALAYPGAGPDLDIPCSGYADSHGHMTQAGRTNAQADLAAFFAVPPTTTTTVLPTTTTTTMPVVWPAQSGERFDVILSRVDLAPNSPDTRWWIAPYFRTLTSGAGWTDGDRCQYRALYTFLLDEDGSPVGRVTFFRVEGAAAYAAVKDFGMDDVGPDGGRNYDGTLPPPPLGEQECPRPTEAYDPFEGDQRPTIDFVKDGQVLERRNYKTTSAHPAITFRQLPKVTQLTVVDGNGFESMVFERITVLAYENGLPVIGVYYDTLVAEVSVVSDLG